MTKRSITLKITHDDQTTETLVVEKDRISIGHVATRDVWLPSALRDHAHIELKDNGASVTPTQDGAVLINDKLIPAVSTKLEVGDVLTIGDDTVEVIALVIAQKVPDGYTVEPSMEAKAKAPSDQQHRDQADADLRAFDAKHGIGRTVTWITTLSRSTVGAGWIDMLRSFGVPVVVATEPGSARGKTGVFVVDSDLASLGWVLEVTNAAELVGGRVFRSEGPARVDRIAELEAENEKLGKALEAVEDLVVLARDKVGEILGRKLGADETLVDAVHEAQGRYQAVRSQLAAVAKALRLVPGASEQAMVEAISRLHEDIDEANATLAEWCPECDPTRCSLSGTVALLVADVLKPQADCIADMKERLARAPSSGSDLRHALIGATGCDLAMTDGDLIALVRDEILGRARKLRRDVIEASKMGLGMMGLGIYHSDEEIVAQVQNMARILDRLTEMLGEDDPHHPVEVLAASVMDELRTARERVAELEQPSAAVRRSFVATREIIYEALGSEAKLGESLADAARVLVTQHANMRKRLDDIRVALETSLARPLRPGEFSAEYIGGLVEDRASAWARIDELEGRTRGHHGKTSAGVRSLLDGLPCTTPEGRQVRGRLVEFFYLLTRDELPSGSVKKLLRNLAPLGSDRRYGSPGGEAMARECVHELLTGEKPPREAEADKVTAEPKLSPPSKEIVDALRRTTPDGRREIAAELARTWDGSAWELDLATLPEPEVVDWTSPSIIGRRVVVLTGEELGSPHGDVVGRGVPGEGRVWVPVRRCDQLSYRYINSELLLLAPAEEPSE